MFIKTVTFVCSVLLLNVVYAQDEKKAAIDLINKAAAIVTEKGIDSAKAIISAPEGPFVKGELYVFAYDTTGTMAAHPKNAKLIGKNMLEVPDVDGKFFRKEIMAIAKDKGTGWVDYKYKNPESGKVEAKTTYVCKVGTLVLCCGIYKN